MGLKCISRSSCIWFLQRLFLTLLVLSFTAIVLYSNFAWVLMEYQVYKPCNLEKINYRDKSLGDFFLESPKPNCDDWKTMVSFDGKGLQKDDDVIKSYGFSPDDVNCEYSLIARKDKGEELRFKFKPISFPISADFCFVRCFHNVSNIIYQGLHSRVKRRINDRTFLEEGQGRPSIIVLVLDSVSRLVAERTLPNTMKYLRNRLNAYEMKGYTKIGDNSQPNFVALMTGKFQYETVMTPSLDYPWLFRQIINNGYMTCYADDWDPALPGYFFKLPEYDHYMIHASFFHAALMENATSFVKDSKGNTWYATHRSLCFQNQFLPNAVLGYIGQCIEVYKTKAKFVLMWQNELAHSGPNHLHLFDNSLKSFFENLHDTHKLNNTFVFLTSDHGPRYGPILKSDIVRRTNPLPLLSIVAPPFFQKQFPKAHKNLLDNTEKLTSTFDLFKTLSDIVTLNFERTTMYERYISRGISMFKEIPSDRSCYDASIPESYCPCYTFSNISVEGTNTKEVANYLVDHINEILSGYKNKCMELTLTNIKYARVQYVPREHKVFQNSLRYVVTVQTSPGDGLFQGTAERFNTSTINILGDVNRLNAYGTQSHCINDRILKLYCYCVQ